MQVTVFSHNFSVRGYNRHGYEFLKKFGVDNFGEVDFRAIRINKMPSRFRKKPLPTIKKTYAACTADGREFRFHRNTLDLFKEAVSNEPGLCEQVTYTEEPMYAPEHVGLKVLPKWTPRENQVPLIGYFNSPGSTKILNLMTGGGKAERNSELVLTMTGWRTIGSMKVGDVVICPDGQLSNVVGVYPQGVKDVYRITFYDGRVIDCCAEHLWKVYSVNTAPANRWRVTNTLDIIRMLGQNNPRVAIPLSQPVQNILPERFPLDPYLVGVLLGDGCLTTNTIGICKEDLEVIERCRPPLEEMGYYLHHLPERNTYAIRRGDTLKETNQHPLKDILVSLGMFGKRSWEKSIPACYMDISVESRKALLQGLMDTDGYVRENGHISFSTTSEVMANQFQQLVWSMGDICKVLPKQKHYTYKGEKKAGRPSFNCSIRSQKPSQYVYLPRKLARVNDQNQYSVDLKLYIKSVEVVGQDQMTCIAIDHPEHLYLTTNYIVTHNTYCSLESSAHYGERLTICIESRFFNLWAEALDPDSDKQVLDLKKEEVLWIQGSKDLKALLQLAQTNQLDGIKVIVVALRTMANYIETYTRFGEDMLSIYPVLPIDFYKVTKTGTALKDEVHLSLYANYMEELFSHVPRRFSLSATLEDGSFKDKIFGIMFPMDQRFDAGPLKQYIDVTALKYRLREPSQVKYSVRGSSDYNHNAFEQWIMADRGRLNNYLKLILDWVDRRFVRQVYFEGQKCVVFVSSIEMASEVWKYLKKNIPHWQVSRYAASAGDVYDEAKQADIMITTEKSFSTGFDLPGLVCALLTVSINSFNTNVQILGRLRELRDHPEVTPIFDYLVCEDIQRHIDYHEEKKRTIFKDRVKSHKTKYVNIVV